ncbi:MAG TPA: sugar transferase [Halieaceae bacterium]|nr:sugar transferase [Halieaceae bacterium]
MNAGTLLGTARVFNHHIHVAYYWLAFVDAVLFFGACYLASYFYFLPEPQLLPGHLETLPARAATFTVMTSAALFSMGLYQPRLREGPNGILLRTLGAFAMMTLAMAFLFYFLPALHLWRGVFVYAGTMSLVACLTTRSLFTRTVELDAFKRRVLVLGSGDTAKQIIDRMRRKSDRRGFRVHGFLRFSGEETSVESGKVFTLDRPLSDYVRDNDIQQLVVALDDRREFLPGDELMRCRTMGVDVVDILDFFEQEAGKILVNHAQPEWFIFSQGFRNGNLYAIFKRAFDIGAAFFLLMLAWPFMLATVLAIWWEDGIGAPVIFRQRRVGLGGKIFEVKKFRSMTVDAEGDGKARWATPGDARVTRVGAVIRKLRIDELPQITNVLAGDMAFVGPRPERPEFVRELAEEIPFFDKRHCVKPGITGWAQLNYPYGASVNDARCKLEFDLYYVKNQSLFLDFLILLQTAEVILFGKGAR